MQQPLPSLPGTGQPRRGLFVDHLGTLLNLPSRGYLKDASEVEFTEDALEALFAASQNGWNIYLVGNEASLYEGQVSSETWEAIHEEINSQMRAHGVCPQRSYICTDHPDAPEPNNKDSVYRLPNTGPMYHAAQADGISLPHSWVIGDQTIDLVAGWRAGCHMAGVRTGAALQDGNLQVEPEMLGENLSSIIRQVAAGAQKVR